MLTRATTAVAIMVLVGRAAGQPQATLGAGDGQFTTDVIVSGVKVPSAIAFLPDGRALVAERETGTVDLVDVQKRVATRVDDVPAALTGDDAGIHEIVLHPNYRTNGWIYMTYSEGDAARSTTVVARMRLRGHSFVDLQRIFTADAYSEDRYHYGGRIAFVNGYLFLSIGDRHHEHRAQELSNHAGKIVRLHDDGLVPTDNPFVHTKDARPEIWSYGHRNPQGLAVNPQTGVLWEHEHGPLAGDELNIIERGANYGWPTISYGWQYDGGPIGRGIVAQEGMKQPLWVWTPAIAPSGMLWYTGDRFPQWRNSLFIGSMAQRHLNRLSITDGRVVVEERLLGTKTGRIRCVAQGLDGLLYIGSDNGDILRLSPVGQQNSR